MRILVSTRFDIRAGGVESYLGALLPALVKKGHTLALLVEHPLPGARPRIDDGGAPLERINVTDRWNALAAASAFAPDIIYQQGIDDPRLEEGLLALAPAILFAHEFHGTCVSGEKSFGVPHLEPCTHRFGLACLARYLPRRCGGLSPLTALRQYGVQASRNRMLHRYSRILVASRAMRREFLENSAGRSDVTVAPLFSTSLVMPAHMPVRERPSGKLLMVSRLTELKGGHLALAALPLAERALGLPLELTIAGEGPHRPALEALAADQGLRVQFLGLVDAERRQALMRASDLLVVPSAWPEPFGLVGLEAGAEGLPAVGFDVGGIPDWLRNGVSGELASGGRPHPSSLAEAIVRALKNPAHHALLCTGAWNVSREFTLARHVELLDVAFQDAAQSKREVMEHFPGKQESGL